MILLPKHLKFIANDWDPEKAGLADLSKVSKAMDLSYVRASADGDALAYEGCDMFADMLGTVTENFAELVEEVGTVEVIDIVWTSICTVAVVVHKATRKRYLVVRGRPRKDLIEVLLAEGVANTTKHIGPALAEVTAKGLHKKYLTAIEAHLSTVFMCGTSKK
jgi:hypothetical protein